MPCQKRDVMDVRPLRLRELYGRAAVLYAANFKVLFGIAFVVAVPLTIAGYFFDAAQTARMEDLRRALMHPGATLPTIAQLFGSRSDAALFASLVAASGVLWTFALGAIANAVERLYMTQDVTIVRSYAAALRRWPSVTGTFALSMLLVFTWYVATLAATLIALLGGLMVSGGRQGFAIVPGAILLSVALMFFPLVAMISAFAINAAVLERRQPLEAIVWAARRIVTHAEFRRALVFSLSLFVALFAAQTLTAGLVAIAPAGPASYAAAALRALIDTAIAAYVIVLVLTYYFDVRIRREGLDLQSAFGGLDSMGLSTQTATDAAEPVYSATRYLSAQERPLIKRFLERRAELDADSRRTLAQQFATPVRQRVPIELQQLDDESLLERL